MGQILERALGVCSVGRGELDYLHPLFKRYFGEYLRIIPMPVDSFYENDEVPRVIMATYITEKAVREQFPDSKVIVMRRCLTGQNIESVIQLQEGAKALVVNWPEQAAHEVIHELETLGIQHATFTPYWPGSNVDPSRHDVVIFTGSDYYPEGDFRYIDLGHRTVALSTLLEVIKEFDLPVSCGEHFYQDNIKQIIRGSFRLSQLLRMMQQMRDNLEKVCDFNQNVTFTFDQDENILIFNPASSELFGKSRQEALGKSFRQVLGQHGELLELLSKPEGLTEALVKVKRQEMLLSTAHYSTEDGVNTLVSLVLVEKLQQSASNARGKLHAKEFTAKYVFSDILGESAEIKEALRTAKTYACSDATVMITGESGVGKELFAQSIHNASARRGKPFVAVNFAALPEALAESELFGYNEGAFTGALRGGKRGLFEIAHQGTIFLDEIGDASLALQTKLLRVLEERELLRIGCSNVIPIDIRVICATNKNLVEMIAQGAFRADLYYRIKILPLHIPPLRRRRADIGAIVTRMLTGSGPIRLLRPEVMALLEQYDWPGNVRELRGIVEYMIVLGRLCEQGAYDLPTIHGMLAEFIRNNLVQPDGAPCKFKGVPTLREPVLDEGLYQILQAIGDLRGMGVIAGRGTLSRMETIRRAGLSEAKLKTRLKHLQELGLVQAGTTKQGTELTPKGKALLQERKTQ